MNKKHRDQIRMIGLLPNGKAPLSSFKSWNPYTSFYEFKTVKAVQRVLIVVGLLCFAAGLVVLSTK